MNPVVQSSINRGGSGGRGGDGGQKTPLQLEKNDDVISIVDTIILAKLSNLSVSVTYCHER